MYGAKPVEIKGLKHKGHAGQESHATGTSHKKLHVLQTEWQITSPQSPMENSS